MRKIVPLVLMVSLLCFGFLVPPREAGAVAIDFTTIANATHVTTISAPWVLGDLSMWAFSTQLPLSADRSVTVDSGNGLGIIDGSTSNRWVNNGLAYIEGLILKVPESFYFTSITLSGLTGNERAMLRAVADFDLTDLGDFLESFTDPTIVTPGALVTNFSNNDWQWILLRTPAPTLLGGVSSSFYVAGLTYEAVPAAPAPEPTTMFLVGSGLIGLAGFARRRFKR
jgi:hypothetical protein